MEELPGTLQKDAEEAEKEYEELLSTGSFGKESEGKPEEGITETPDEGEKAPEKAPEEEKKSEEGKEAEPKPEGDDYDRLKAEHEKLLHTHSVLQGKYNAEVPRLHDEIDVLREGIESLRVAKPEDKKDIREGLDKSTKRLADEYGEDFVSDVVTILKAEMQKEIETLKPTIEGLSTTLTKNVRGKFIEDLTSKVQNWETVRDDPEFSIFLQQAEPYSGESFLRLLTDADRRNDPVRTARIYQTYKDLKSPPTGDKEPPKGEGNKKPSKEDFLEPSSRQGVINTDTNNKPIYSQAEVDKFYNDFNKGRLKISQEDFEKTDQGYELAAVEGRIR